MNLQEQALLLHEQWQGKIEVVARCPVKSADDMTMAYTPGVAQPCLEIEKNPDLIYKYTRRWNMVAVITDGTAVLGLGDIGPEAAMPVMEGKCVLFKSFAGVDAFPLCIRSKDVDEIVRTIALISGSFGGINLEDIAAPRCFEIERKLKEVCDIPIFHDDQHGTAVVVIAALTNALRVVGKKPSEVKIAISGAGAAAISVTRLLLKYGVGQVCMCDIEGIIYEGKPNLDPAREEMSRLTNPDKIKGTLADIVKDADVFIGLSAANLVSEEMIRSMAPQPVIFAMANPTPEIMPDQAIAAGAAVVGTGRSDYPNQINNVLAFPGIFRGALDVRASDINEQMKLAAAFAIASLVDDEQLNAKFILPPAFDPAIGKSVAIAVAAAARASGVARI